MIRKTCAKCGKIISYGKRYCDTCQVIADRQADERKLAANKRYNRKRNKDEQRFYSSKQWRLLSAGYLADKYWRCEECGAIATEVHHIAPIQTAEGWERRYAYDNLRAVCVRCHNREHNRWGEQSPRGGQ